MNVSDIFLLDLFIYIPILSSKRFVKLLLKQIYYSFDDTYLPLLDYY